MTLQFPLDATCIRMQANNFPAHLVTLLLLMLIMPAGAWGCPDYLNHTFKRLHSNEQVNLCEAYGDRPLLVINTASFCGYTPQFKGLEALHRRYGPAGLTVIGFPSNDFFQESSEEEKTAEVCYINYGVTFPMMSESSVKGRNANPVFKALADRTRAPRWNFNKYLIDSDGEVVAHFGSNIKPEDRVLTGAIESLLRQ